MSASSTTSPLLHPIESREASLHNTFGYVLPGHRDLGLSPAPLSRSRPRIYHLLLGWSCFFFWVFGFFAVPRIDLGWLCSDVSLSGCPSPYLYYR